MYSWSKESHLFQLTRSVKQIEAEPFGFWLLPPPPPPHPLPESTLLLQLLQTEKGMDLRFSPDKEVRTLSLPLTPLSHQCERESVEGHRGTVSQSLPPSSCLKPSATELPPVSLYLILKPVAKTDGLSC